ncbi:MAG: LysR family transcriptional regulator [Meiothermus sp.]|mgnify:FL=1
MRLDPESLLTFTVVAQQGSLSRAARLLHRTQPAISNQMTKLAERVGEPLFTRHPHGVRLTAAGEALLPHALALKRALEGALEAVEALRGLKTGRLRLAASTTIAHYCVPKALARLRRAHPGLEVELRVGNSQEVLDLLKAGEAELALVEGHLPQLPPGFEAEVLARDRLLLVTPPGHPLAGRRVGPRELTGLEVIWRERGSGTRQVAERALEGVKLKAVLELPGSEAVKQAVRLGLGVAFLSEYVVEAEVQAGLLGVAEVDLPGLERPFTLLRPPQTLLSRAALAFLEASKDEGKGV